MAISNFNPRTVLKAMLAARNTLLSTMGNGSNGTGGPNTSRAVGMCTQGIVTVSNGIEIYPLYLHTMQTNLTTMQRHPNQTSNALLFTTATGALIGQCVYQELIPGGSLGWTVPTSTTAAALPDQVLAFNTTTPGAVVWNSADILFQRAPAVLYPGDMRRISNPTVRGALAAQAGAGDKIKIILRSSPNPNEFRVFYDFYTVANGPANPAYTVVLWINGTQNRLTEFTVKPAVAVDVNELGSVSRRRDIIPLLKAEPTDRTIPYSERNVAAFGSWHRVVSSKWPWLDICTYKGITSRRLKYPCVFYRRSSSQ